MGSGQTIAIMLASLESFTGATARWKNQVKMEKRSAPMSTFDFQKEWFTKKIFKIVLSPKMVLAVFFNLIDLLKVYLLNEHLVSVWIVMCFDDGQMLIVM